MEIDFDLLRKEVNEFLKFNLFNEYGGNTKIWTPIGLCMVQNLKVGTNILTSNGTFSKILDIRCSIVKKEVFEIEGTNISIGINNKGIFNLVNPPISVRNLDISFTTFCTNHDLYNPENNMENLQVPGEFIDNKDQKHFRELQNAITVCNSHTCPWYNQNQKSFSTPINANIAMETLNAQRIIPNSVHIDSQIIMKHIDVFNNMGNIVKLKPCGISNFKNVFKKYIETTDIWIIYLNTLLIIEGSSKYFEIPQHKLEVLNFFEKISTDLKLKLITVDTRGNGGIVVKRSHLKDENNEIVQLNQTTWVEFEKYLNSGDTYLKNRSKMLCSIALLVDLFATSSKEIRFSLKNKMVKEYFLRLCSKVSIGTTERMVNSRYKQRYETFIKLDNSKILLSPFIVLKQGSNLVELEDLNPSILTKQSIEVNTYEIIIDSDLDYLVTENGMFI